jgi:pyruvate dehydrogenase E2 component (dihydrolipoamide acetyltransferase)
MSERIKQFNLPDLGEGLTEGQILTWGGKVGDTVALNQPIVEVETAKAAVEIPAKWAGQVSAIYHGEGETVEVGTAIIAIDTEPGAGPAPTPTPSAAALAAVEVAPAEGAVEPGLIGGPAPGGRTAVLVGYGPKNTVAKRRPRIGGSNGPAPAPAVTAPAALAVTAPAVAAPAVAVSAVAAPAPVALTGTPGTGVLAKPPVRKFARDLGVDLSGLAGSGPSGSITRDDVQAALSGGDRGYSRPLTEPSFGPDREQRIPVKGVRKLTAESMVASAFSAPHVTEFVTIDVTRTVKALDRLRARPEWQGARVSPLLLVAKAVLAGIERHPMVNSSWHGEEIVVKQYVNLGVAAATERGLIVPNIKDAGRLSLRELADAMTALVQTAKSGRTPLSDMTGGTFTITNVGVFGVDTGTPILPPGEAAILAFGAIREVPWIHHGKIKKRHVTTLGLSFDHRIIDGELGSRFLRDVADFLIDPAAVLLAQG